MAERRKTSRARGFAGAPLLLALIAIAGTPARSQDPAPPAAEAPPAGAGSCAKAEFESAVDDAAAALRDLNNKNRPEFQDRLRHLKEKRGWDNDQFLKEAAPYVKDEEIEVFDEKSNELLATISSMGQEGSAAKSPDCAMLTELRGHMTTLVETQTAKWTYMFEKLDKALAE